MRHRGGLGRENNFHLSPGLSDGCFPFYLVPFFPPSVQCKRKMIKRDDSREEKKIGGSKEVDGPTKQEYFSGKGLTKPRESMINVISQW